MVDDMDSQNKYKIGWSIDKKNIIISVKVFSGLQPR